MNKLILVITLVLSSIICNSQIKTSTILKDSILDSKIPVPMQLKAGSCGSPDGAMNSTAINPPNYTWLQNNGYCNPSAYGFTPTVCWTFVPTSSSVTINSGFSYNCANVTFSNFQLYDASCSLVGTGLSFAGLTPGSTYTWCMDGNTWNSFIDDLINGPCTGFVDFCPYFFNNIVLPIELIGFNGYEDDNINIIEWSTLSEINNDYFQLEKSEDGHFWETLGIIDGAGNSSSEIHYRYSDYKPYAPQTYYRLKQIDFDGAYEYSDIISIQNNNTKFYTYTKSDNNGYIYFSNPKSYEFYNIMGQLIISGYGDNINIESLNSGIYVLKIGNYTKKFYVN